MSHTASASPHIAPERKQYLHPVWVRLWHWLNALLFVALIVTGFSMHFSGVAGPLVEFSMSRAIHNASGWILIANFVIYVAGLLVSGQWRQFLSFRDGFVGSMIEQARYYTRGIFLGEPHPEHPTPKRKFNALQQVTYLGIVATVLPAVMITGVMLLFPELAPKQILGNGGVWPVAMLHTVIAYLLVAFTVGHIYLATTGETPDENIRAMISGWHESSHTEFDHSSDATPSHEEKGAH